MGPPMHIRADAKEMFKWRGFTRLSAHFCSLTPHSFKKQETGDQVSIHIAFCSRRMSAIRIFSGKAASGRVRKSG